MPRSDVLAAMEAARKAQESVYYDKCTIISYQEIDDPDTGMGELVEVIEVEDEPCKLSFETLPAAGSQEDGSVAALQVVKLFISPDVAVNPDSKIIVTRMGHEYIYKRSGEVHIDPVHQEFKLEPFEEKA